MTVLSEGKLSPPTPTTNIEEEIIAQEAQSLGPAMTKADRKTPIAGEEGPSTSRPKNLAQPSLANYFRVLSYGTRLDYLMMALCIFTSIGSGATMPLMIIIFGGLVSDFTNYFVPGTSVTESEFQSLFGKQALYIVYLFIAKFFLSYISMFTVRITGLRISAALRLAYLRATFAQPVSIIDTLSPGKVSTRITTSSNTIQVAISHHFATLWQALAFTLGFYIVAFVKSWLLTFVASAALPFILIAYGSLIPPFMRIHKITERHHEDASGIAFEMFSSIRIIVAFGAEAKLARQHEEFLNKAAHNEKRAAPLMGLMMSPSMMVQYGTFGLAFWFGIRQYSQGRIDDISQIIIVLFSVMTAMMNITKLTSPIIGIAKAANVSTELFTIIDAHVPDTSGLKEPDITASSSITFENVTFSYPSRPSFQVLHGLNLELTAGKTTAIVGPSGSGKSTIVGLVQRWYDLSTTTPNVIAADKNRNTDLADVLTENPVGFKMEDNQNAKTSSKLKKAFKAPEDEEKNDEDSKLESNSCTGAIKVGKTNLCDVDLKWWRSQIGLVQQEPFLFNDTLYNNVAFGLSGTQYQNLSEDEKMDMVKQACREACAEEFILQLPEGYQTLVGESGIKLSGGQRQRIAIARSIVKDPPILILDEATSAIDVRTERTVQQALDRVSKHRTTIVIAHRLSTIKRADTIVVLRQGKIIEQGTHQQLLNIETGLYRGLVVAQELTMEAEEETADDSNIGRTDSATYVSSGAQHCDGEKELEDAKYRKRGLLRSFGRLIYEQRHHWFLYSIAVLGILGAGAVYPLQAYIFANVIQVFTYEANQLVSEGNFWAGMYGVIAAGVGLSYFSLSLATHLISISLARHYRQEYLDNMIRKRITFFDSQENNPGSLTSILSSDITQLQQLMSTEMSMALIAIVNLVGSLVIAFTYGWKLSLVGLFAALPLILAAGYLRMRLEIQADSLNTKVFANSSQFATEAVGAFRTVLSLVMEDTIGDRYQTLLTGHVIQASRDARWATFIFAASDSVELACMALTLWYGGTLLASHEYTLIDFFVVYMAIVQGAMAAGMWFSFAPNMAQAAAAANRILNMRTPKTSSLPSYLTLCNPSGGAEIELRDVCFTYKSREVPILKNLNIKVLPGQFAALVGASGCGKSTTISLLERFYDTNSGHVLFNGQDITHLNPSEYRKQISLVSQETTLYEGTIRDNISLSMDAATEEEITKACIDAQIHDFITSLPEGYDTRLGAKGMNLSGGQKQRLSLARALLRKPKLLLLDEATSSLDGESEKLVQVAIERAAGESGRTILAVAHRLATIQKADIIFVLGSGKVLEQGDHQTLLRRRGLYWQMCQAQALDH